MLLSVLLTVSKLEFGAWVATSVVKVLMLSTISSAADTVLYRTSLYSYSVSGLREESTALKLPSDSLVAATLLVQSSVPFTLYSKYTCAGSYSASSTSAWAVKCPAQVSYLLLALIPVDTGTKTMSS